MRHYQHDHTKKWSKIVDEADGFIIVTPEYNHGYSAGLNNAIDYLYKEWTGKPVSFVSYGGVSGGLRAVEQLRQVVIELRMQPLREQVSIPFVRGAVREGKLPHDDARHKQLQTHLADLASSLS